MSNPQPIQDCIYNIENIEKSINSLFIQIEELNRDKKQQQAKLEKLKQL